MTSRRAVDPFWAEDRARVPWVDVDVDEEGNPLPVGEEPDETTRYWTGPGGRRYWVIGEG